MTTTHDPQPKSGFGLPWSIAASIAAIGAMALIIAIVSSSRRTDPNLATLERDINNLQMQLAKVETDLNVARDAGKGPAADLKMREERNKSEAERIGVREMKVKELEAKNRVKVAQVQTQIDETKREMEKELKKLPDQPAADDQELAKFRASVSETQNAIVTIVSSQGIVATGFFISGFKQPTIVTTLEMAPADQELSIKLRNAENAGDEEPFDGTARLIYADKESGLSFLIFSPKEQVKLTALSKKMIREASRGEKAFAIATLMHGARFGEFSVSSGSVSSTEVEKGDRKLMQLAMPTNQGSFGAPVLGSDANLIGIVVSRVDGIEKSVLAIPALEIPKAIGRMVASLSKK